MVFAFPAYHEDEKTFKKLGLLTLKECVRDSLEGLGWTCYEEDGYWDGGTPFNFFSWGENIVIEILEDDETVRMKSSCKMPTQCIDWGKNKRNVNEFFAMLRDVVVDAREG